MSMGYAVLKRLKTEAGTDMPLAPKLGICGVVSLLPVNLHDVALNQIEGVLYF
jgi:hypothetical protein